MPDNTLPFLHLYVDEEADTEPIQEFNADVAEHLRLDSFPIRMRRKAAAFREETEEFIAHYLKVKGVVASEEKDAIDEVLFPKDFVKE